MRMNAKELIADARVTAPTLPPAAAKLMTAMADRLDLQFVALCESRNEVKHLAAENTALKSNLMFWDAEDPESPFDCPEDIANNFAMDFNTEFDVQVAAKMPNRTYRVSEVGEYDCKIELVSGGMPETPATDAFLASLRAEGVEMAIDAVLNVDTIASTGALKFVFHQFAAQLRNKTEPSPETAAIARQFEQLKGDEK
ncbi:hypothetical protein [Kosakonia cowanii]|uniref:hypothetical protein n=1 Tax=Kosakonia cowanii TaxID=208223 RepID=UPI003D98E93F